MEQKEVIALFKATGDIYVSILQKMDRRMDELDKSISTSLLAVNEVVIRCDNQNMRLNAVESKLNGHTAALENMGCQFAKVDGRIDELEESRVRISDIFLIQNEKNKSVTDILHEQDKSHINLVDKLNKIEQDFISLANRVDRIDKAMLKK